MPEGIIVARRQLCCDLCLGVIHEGEKCRMIRDDFQRWIVRFEHLRCPDNPAVAVKPQEPHAPKNIHNNAIFA